MIPFHYPIHVQRVYVTLDHGLVRRIRAVS